MDGPGGTGKMYLYKALLAKVRSMDLIAVATATSGIAASIMHDGPELPVVPRGTRAQITDATLQHSYIWEKIQKIYLIQNMRAQNDIWYSEFLLRIGNGTEVSCENDYVQLPDDIIIEYQSEESLDRLIESYFLILPSSVHVVIT